MAEITLKDGTKGKGIIINEKVLLSVNDVFLVAEDSAGFVVSGIDIINKNDYPFFEVNLDEEKN